MAKKVKISVIITAKNESSTIATLLSSLSNQTLLPTEVVICDAFSSDGTWEWLQEHQSDYAFKLTLLQKKGNRSVGRNAAIEKATSTLIAVTDAGCVASPRWLDELVAALHQQAGQETEAVVIAGHTIGAPQTSLEEAIVPYVLVMSDRIDRAHYLPATRSMLITTSAWQKLGRFDESLDDSEDYAFARKLQSDPDVTRDFAEKAVVSWRPRTTMWSFAQMIYHYAYGDAQSNSFRPKILTIYFRYVLGIGLAISTFVYESVAIFMVLLASVALYAIWSILKNKRYLASGWYWLPVLQVASDLAVMWGTTCGYVRRK